MGESKKILFSLVVAALGIAVVIIGFMAEAARRIKLQPSQVIGDYGGVEPECDCPSGHAVGLAIAAIVVLVLTRIIITSATGVWFSCHETVAKRSKFARFCMVISWITYFIAIVLFIIGAKLSSENGVERQVGGDFYCYTMRPAKVFSGAGILGFVSVLLGLVYYLSYGPTSSSGAAEKPPVALELQNHQTSTKCIKAQVSLQKD